MVPVSVLLAAVFLCAVSWFDTCRRLQLCEWGASSSYGAAQCGGFGGGCQGSYNTNCNPDSFWSNTKTDIGYHSRSYLNSGIYGQGGEPDGNAFSVRCVLDLNRNIVLQTDRLQLCENYESSKYGAARYA